MGSIFNFWISDKSESKSESEETEETKTDSPLIVNVKHIQYLYEFEIKDNDDFNLKKTDSKIELNIEESNKISESEKRSVYKGKIDDVKDCVVKTYKKNNGEDTPKKLRISKKNASSFTHVLLIFELFRKF